MFDVLKLYKLLMGLRGQLIGQLPLLRTVWRILGITVSSRSSLESCVWRIGLELPVLLHIKPGHSRQPCTLTSSLGRVQQLTVYNRPVHWASLLDRSAVGQLSSLSSRTKWQRLPAGDTLRIWQQFPYYQCYLTYYWPTKIYLYRSEPSTTRYKYISIRK